MRIALFHAWSSLGAAVAEALLARARAGSGDEVALFGAPTDTPDPELVALGSVVADEAAALAFAPDLVLVATFPTKLSGRVIAAARHGAYNLHPSLLPAYRGAQPEFWVVRNGEAETGISLHRMTDRFDAGPVVARARIRLGPHDTMESVTERLASLAPPLVVDLVERLGRGEGEGEGIAGEPQDEARVTRAPAVREEHLAIRWSETAASIERLVRACDPWFEAHTTFNGARVVVRRCTLGAPTSTLAPGEIGEIGTEDGRVVVGTGEGSLVLEEIEPPDGYVRGARFVHIANG